LAQGRKRAGRARFLRPCCGPERAPRAPAGAEGRLCLLKATSAMSGGPTGNPYSSNRHADVLNEEPTEEGAKLRLVEEVKNRAKGAFSQKDMPSAELLYGKAISLLDSLPGKAEAALYSNRSMVRLNLSKVESALEDAKKCISLDPKFVKGYYRKGMALNRLNEWDDAIAAAQEGLKLEPTNKSFEEIIAQAEKEKAADVEAKANLKRDAQDVRVELHNASTARAPPVKKEKLEGEEADGKMRGYKKTADGKTTSYFHTEISEEAKKLIAEQGFGKPKKIEGEIVETEVKAGGSKWNQAGTYEEKNMSKWAEDSLKEALSGLTFEVPNGAGGVIKTTSVVGIKGDANISMSRGKRRHLLDLSFDVEFEGKLGANGSGPEGTGKLCFAEVTTNEGEDPEVKAEINSSTAPELREVFDAFVKPAGQGLQPVVLAALRKVIEEYKQK